MEATALPTEPQPVESFGRRFGSKFKSLLPHFGHDDVGAADGLIDWDKERDYIQ